MLPTKWVKSAIATSCVISVMALVGCGGVNTTQSERGANIEQHAGQASSNSTTTPVEAATTTDPNSPPAEAVTPPAESRMIGPDRRLAVRNECWYALNQAWINKPNDDGGPGSDKTLSNWHYISTDGNNNALRYVLKTYGGYVSDQIPGIGGSLTNSQIEQWIPKFTSDNYAMNYDTTKGYGHGCQCVTFATMILYRALNGYQISWNWASLNPSSFQSATYAQPGDLVFYKTGSSTGHVAVCVRNYGSGITVVDSNYLGHEVIGRHDVSNGTISGGSWKRYSGQGKWY